MTHIYFVRHAQPNYENHDDASRELTAKGLADRQLVTRLLSRREVDIVLSNPFRRAVDTVRDLADHCGLPVITVADLRERQVDSGWIRDFNTFSRRQWADFHYKLPGGESLEGVQRRNIAALEQILCQHRDKTIVIGSHGTALSTIIHYYQPDFGFEDFQRIQALMPWVVHFTFDGIQCTAIDAIDPFTGERTALYCA